MSVYHMQHEQYDAIKVFHKLGLSFQAEGMFLSFDCPFCENPWILLSTQEEHSNTAYCPTCEGSGLYSLFSIVSKINNLSHSDAKAIMDDCRKECDEHADLRQAS